MFFTSKKVSANQTQMGFRARPSTSITSEEFKLLSESLTFYSKKTGAGTKKDNLESSPILSLFTFLSQIINIISVIMSEKDIQSNMKYQIYIVIPYLSHFDRILSNIIRILNDRIAMLWRPTSNPDLVCIIYNDIASLTAHLNKFIAIFKSRNMLQPSNSLPSTSTLLSTTSRLTGLTSTCGMGTKQSLLKVQFHRSRTIPYMLHRVENYIQNNVSLHINNICKTNLISNYFIGSQMKDKLSSNNNTIGVLVVKDVLSPILTTLIKYSKSPYSEKILQCVCNHAIDSILNYIKDCKLSFDQQGVITLYMELITIRNWISDSKSQLNIPLSVSIINDLVPWYRANAILQLLVAATSRADSLYTSRYLSNSDQELWSQLGQSSSIGCFGFKIKIFPFRHLMTSSASVGVTPFLDIQDL